MPDAQKDDIFGKGQRGLDSAGTGVGLYLMQPLVKGYGGSTRVEDRAEPSPGAGPSQAGGTDPKGAVFVVTLPIAG